MTQETVYRTANFDTNSSAKSDKHSEREGMRPTSDIFNRINALSDTVNRKIYIHPDDEKEVYVVLHYQRMTGHFSAILILAEQGMQHQVEVLLRSLLELTFNLVSYYQHEDLFEAMTVGGDEQRRQVLQKLFEAQHAKPTLTLHELDQLKLMVSSAENIDRGDVPVYVKAELAGLLNEYRTTYQLLSESVHGSLHSLVEDIEVDEASNSIIGINSNSANEKNLTSLLLASADFLLMGTEVMFKMYKQLSVYDEELQRLKIQLHDEWKHHVVKVPHRQKHI